MSAKHMTWVMTMSAFAAGMILANPARAGAQVGTGLVDPNVAAEKALLALPHMTPARVTALIAKRPFASVTDLNAFLLNQKLTEPQRKDFYAVAFVHVNLNTGTRDEILLIPGAGTRMAHEFVEYRPWRNWAQFEKEIGKYVGAAEAARLWRYVVIP